MYYILLLFFLNEIVISIRECLQKMLQRWRSARQLKLSTPESLTITNVNNNKLQDEMKEINNDSDSDSDVGELYIEETEGGVFFVFFSLS